MSKLHLSTYYALGSLTMCGMRYVPTVCIRRALAPFQCHHEDKDDGIYLFQTRCPLMMPRRLWKPLSSRHLIEMIYTGSLCATVSCPTKWHECFP